MARRGNYTAHLGRTFTVTMGGQNLGVYSPLTTTWEQELTGAVVANAASLQLVLEAGAEPGIDFMALIDDVAVMPAHLRAARAMGIPILTGTIPAGMRMSCDGKPKTVWEMRRAAGVC